jgi:hypothetical protein
MTRWVKRSVLVCGMLAGIFAVGSQAKADHWQMTVGHGHGHGHAHGYGHVNAYRGFTPSYFGYGIRPRVRVGAQVYFGAPYGATVQYGFYGAPSHICLPPPPPCYQPHYHW